MKTLLIIAACTVISGIIHEATEPPKAPPLEPKPVKLFVVPIAENNRYNKAIGRQLKYENLIRQDLDSIDYLSD